MGPTIGKARAWLFQFSIIDSMKIKIKINYKFTEKCTYPPPPGGGGGVGGVGGELKNLGHNSSKKSRKKTHKKALQFYNGGNHIFVPTF